MTVSASRGSHSALREPVTEARSQSAPVRIVETADRVDPRRVLAVHRRFALVGDLVSAAIAATVAVLWRFGLNPAPEYVAYSALLPLLWAGVVAANRGYEDRYLGTGPEEYRRLGHSGLMLFAGIAVADYAVHSELSRGYVFVAVPLTLLLSLIVRNRLRRRVYLLRKRGLGLQRVLVVGRADAAAAVIEKLDHEPHHGLVPVGACVPSAGGITLSDLGRVPVVGDPGVVLEAVERTRAHVVAVVSHPDLSGEALRRLSWALEERDVELLVSPGIIEVAGPRLSIRPVAGLSLLHLERPGSTGERLAAKAVFDRVVGLLGLAVATPVMLAIALAIKLTSRGPVLFRQTRVGVDGREFVMYKFRSMVVDAEERLAGLLEQSEGNGVLFKMHADPRVTPVGRWLRRFSLDELPQLLNVVRGDMSLVGPRPPLPREVAVYDGDATRRLKVKPGLTGLWQVSGRSDLSWEESLRLDLRYTDNWSLMMDLQILWRTARAVLRGSGAY